MLENIPLIIIVYGKFELMKHIEDEEILKFIWDLETDKAFGLDKFSISIYKTY